MSTAAACSSPSSMRPSASSPMMLNRLTGKPSRPRLRATLPATPPGVRTTRAGFEVAGWVSPTKRALASICTAPMHATFIAPPAGPASLHATRPGPATAVLAPINMAGAPSSGVPWALTARPIPVRSPIPKASGVRRPRPSTGSGPARGCSTTPARPSTAGSRAGVLNTCHNAVDRHVAAGRGDQIGPDLRQPGDRHGAALHLPGAARRDRPGRRRPPFAGGGARRPGDHLHAHDPRSGDRHAGVRPHRARSTRWCSAASPPRSWPPASTTPSRG